MIQFKGYEDLISEIYSKNQEHIFEFWNELNEKEKISLLEECRRVDFALMSELFASTQKTETAKKDFSRADYIPLPKEKESNAAFEKARAAGEEAIKNGRVAAFIVAGGQGSRLGFNGPKGAFRVSPVKEKSLFQIHAEKILKYSKKYQVNIPFFIMTSDENHKATLSHFEENHYFGLSKNDVFMFPQNMIPAIDTNGKLILSSKCSIFKSPDGHGGSLTALKTSGALDEMKKRGIDIISYFQVDNPLVKIVDPTFIGFHTMNKSEVSNKVIPKSSPEEKVGVFVKYSDGSTGIVEYSDLTKEQMYQTEPDGELSYSAGNIAVHLFDREFIEELTCGGTISLEFHIANKKIKSFTREGEKEIQGFKFEKFVFDAIPLAKNALIIETSREEEFAPVKNMTGSDSLETSQELMINLHKSWLKKRGILIPERTKIVEISPLTAVCADDIDRNITIPEMEEVYI